jgi:putative FmdB family regulatory protein
MQRIRRRHRLVWHRRDTATFLFLVVFPGSANRSSHLESRNQRSAREKRSPKPFSRTAPRWDCPIADRPRTRGTYHSIGSLTIGWVKGYYWAEGFGPQATFGRRSGQSKPTPGRLIMPLFEYRCRDCDASFEKITHRDRSDSVVCPECGGSRSRRLLSMFATISQTSDMSMSNLSGGGCACGGSCNCGGH